MAVDRWFRMYESAVTHDKVRGLPNDTLRWQWVILLSVASKYGGVIPSLKVAALNLNVKEAKAAQIIAALNRAELLDRVEGGYFKPHDWNDRQPVDATAAIRMRRYRERQKNERNSDAVTTVTPPVTDTPTELRGKIDDDGDARAREPAKQPWELEPCHDLARQLAEIAGCADEFEFTGWGGATYRVKQWLESGWKPELIVASVRDQAAKKRDGPAKTVKYFEPGIASAIAKANQPLPNIVAIPAKTVEVASATPSPNSAAAAARRIEASIREQLAESGVDNEPYQPTYLSLPAR